MVDRSKFLLAHLDIVDKTINFFTAEFTNPAEFEKIKTLTIETIKKTGNKTDETYIRGGYLSTFDLLIYLGSNKLLGNKGINTQVVDITVNLLVENFIVNPLTSIAPSGQPRYKANMFSLVLKGLDIIHNVIFGFNFIVDRYRKSVFKIEHVSHDLEPSIGTGFLISNGNRGLKVVTNKHVVENHKKLRLFDVDDNELEFGEIFLHPSMDLALIELKSSTNSTPFHLGVSFDVMSEIITIGYPSIPMTKFSYQVVHRGEINSFVEDYEGNKIFLFSAKTSSGNSGSPIISKSGMVLGIATKELFEESAFKNKGKLPYYAAIPSQEITTFLKDMKQE